MELAASPAAMQRQFSESQVWPFASFAAYNALLLGVLLFSDFSAYDLLVVIFIELCVIGFFALLRLGVAVVFGMPFDNHLVHVSRGSTLLLGMLLGGFFVAKFGLLMLALAVVLISLPQEDFGFEISGLNDLHPLVELCVYLLLARYAVMFVWSTLIKGDYKEVSAVRLLLSPYLNGLWVFVTIGIGLFLAYRYPDNPMLFFTLGIFGAKLLLDLCSLLLALRRVRLAPQIEARRQRREAFTRTAALWLTRIVVAAGTLAVVGVIIFAFTQLYSQISLERKLEAHGVVVEGMVAAKEISPGEGNSSTSYAVDVTYSHAAGTYTNTYWIRRHRWEALAVGDPIEITLLPDNPRQSQLTEYVGTSINGRGFIPIRD